jgi:predicted enzyme related to lactoylglutathione lyase
MRLISPHTLISILVNDQDEALQFYTRVLGLEKRSDIDFGPGLRFLTVAPRGQKKPELALAQPDIALYGETYVNELKGKQRQKLASIFVTDNCQETYTHLSQLGVTFVSEPTNQLYGVEAVFLDPYGNPFALIEATHGIRSLFKNKFMGTAA